MSIYFPIVIGEVEHPFLYAFMQKPHARGEAKKFICDAAEEKLERQQKPPKEEAIDAESIRRLEERLDEIREMLRRGVVLQDADADNGGGQESEKVSSLLSKLGM